MNLLPLPPWSIDVFAFLKGVKLLFGSNIQAKPRLKITVKNAIRAGLEIEPRVLEVLPAAIIHYHKNFSDLDKMPSKLRTILNNILTDEPTGPALGGIPYRAMQRWANSTVHDNRLVPAKDLKRPPNFKSKPMVKGVKSAEARKKYKRKHQS